MKCLQKQPPNKQLKAVFVLDFGGHRFHDPGIRAMIYTKRSRHPHKMKPMYTVEEQNLDTQLAAIQHRLPQNESVLVHLGRNSTTFVPLPQPQSKEIEFGILSHDIHIGVEQLANDYFQHDIPGEPELDHAINCIEDELMRNLVLTSGGRKLISADKLHAALFDVDKGMAEFSREQVEQLFTRYAWLSMGRATTTDNLQTSKQAYAALLILREIMHHLDYRQVLIVAD
jgi:hypothetical protein